MFGPGSTVGTRMYRNTSKIEIFGAETDLTLDSNGPGIRQILTGKNLLFEFLLNPIGLIYLSMNYRIVG